MLRILAALIFFTRLPFWKLGEVPAAYFKNIVSYWPIAGWMTAGCMALTLYVANICFPPSVAILLAIAARLLVTGCLHEDGLADFFDGFGGGTTRERILVIMKDSHIGSYGVIGLIGYFGLLYLSLSENKTVYSRMSPGEVMICAVTGLLPLLWLPKPIYLLACLCPPLCWYALSNLMKKRLQGYTGDCCGATFLLCELSFYLGILIIYTLKF